MTNERDEIENLIKASKQPSIEEIRSTEELATWRTNVEQQDRLQHEARIAHNIRASNTIAPLHTEFDRYVRSWLNEGFAINPWRDVINLKKTENGLQFDVYNGKQRAIFGGESHKRFIISADPDKNLFSITEQNYLTHNADNSKYQMWDSSPTKQNISKEEALNFLKTELATHVTNARSARNKFLIKAGIVAAFLFAVDKCSGATVAEPPHAEIEPQKIHYTGALPERPSLEEYGLTNP